MSAEILRFPQATKIQPEIISALIQAGMRQPDDILTIGKGDLAFDIDGHDFYLKRNPAGGFKFHVHGEPEPRFVISPDMVDLQPVVQAISGVLAQ